MDESREISRLGFGAYRAYVGTPEHERSLRRALALGCNLIDTAASYGGGRSEELIGRVLRDRDGEAPYVITKAGYRNGGHCLQPDFLRAELERSRGRLGLRRIDAFLLHNPEQWFDGHEDSAPEDFYAEIERAFECLEEEVEAGAIGCYGVSSNTLPMSTDELTTPSLPRLLEISRRVGPGVSFRIVEFPFNLVEQDALRAHHRGTSLIDLARAAGLRLVGNRPLNAVTPDGALRLATYDEELEGLDEEADGRLVADVMALIERRIRELDPAAADTVPPIVDYLRRGWQGLPAPDLVEGLLARQLWPLVARLYSDAPPADERDMYARFQRTLIAYARRNQTRAAQAFRDGMVADGRLEPDDPRPLALIACQYALEAGLDHVLVGMRRPQYVELMRPLLGSHKRETRRVGGKHAPQDRRSVGSLPLHP